MTINKEIYGLELHECISVARGWATVTRVPGGWLYEVYKYDRENDTFQPYTCVFVPYTREGYRDD